MDNYYIYIYWRLDTNEPFYIGMGHGDRWKTLNRKNNFHFKNIINKYPIVVEIIKDNLTQEQVLDIECWLINELVFEYGFSIYIPNNGSSDTSCNLANQTWGGEGTSEKNNYKARSIICLTTKEIFEAMSYVYKKYNIKSSHLSRSCQGKRKSCGKYKGQKLVWRHLVWKHNKTYRICNK